MSGTILSPPFHAAKVPHQTPFSTAIRTTLLLSSRSTALCSVPRRYLFFPPPCHLLDKPTSDHRVSDPSSSMLQQPSCEGKRHCRVTHSSKADRPTTCSRCGRFASISEADPKVMTLHHQFWRLWLYIFKKLQTLWSSMKIRLFFSLYWFVWLDDSGILIC